MKSIIVTGKTKDIDVLIRENRIRVSRGVLTFSEAGGPIEEEDTPIEEKPIEEEKNTGNSDSKKETKKKEKEKVDVD